MRLIGAPTLADVTPDMVRLSCLTRPLMFAFLNRLTSFCRLIRQALTSVRLRACPTILDAPTTSPLLVVRDWLKFSWLALPR